MIINPYRFGQPLLLDTYSGAAVAYSVRKLRTAYSGAALRVRRSSDNAESNIGFVANQLDTASLLSFVGAGNGFVTTWYDQSGNARNATNTTAANQPQIVSSGSILQINSKPALTFDGTNDSLASSFGSTILHPISIFNTVTYPTYNPSTNKYIFDSASSPRTAFIQSTLNRLQLFSGVVLEVPNTYIFNQGSQYLFSTLSNSTSSYISVNGNIEVTGNSGTSGINALTLARRFSNAEYADVKYQELVLYPSNQTTNKSLIETNINSYFNIYP